MRALEAEINALTSLETNYMSSKSSCGDGELERKHHDLVFPFQFQRAKG